MGRFDALTREVLEQRYIVEGVNAIDIAKEFGCSEALVRARIRDWKINPGRSRRAPKMVVPWNLGLTKHTDPRLAMLSLMHEGENNPMAGKKAWNRGIKREDDPRVEKMVKAMRDGFNTSETRYKMALAKVGMKGEHANNWKGGISFGSNYILENGEYQHRVVAQRILGRSLTSEEHVHHKDANTYNNSPENLIVLSGQDHLRLHSQMKIVPNLDQIEWLKSMGFCFKELV